jgi:hypothetical protein
MAREFLMMHEESSYGTVTLTSGAPTTGRFMFLRLSGANSFTPRLAPVRSDISYGAGLAMGGLPVADSWAIRGTLRTELYYAQAQRLMRWCTTRINSGRTLPWVTTDSAGVMPAGDLASMSLYHGVMRQDGTYKRRRYGGAKVLSWRLECSRQSPVAVLSMEIQASQAYGTASPLPVTSDPNSTEFPFPTDAQLPTNPVLFSQSASGVSLNSTRTLYEGLTLAAQNAMSPKWFESRFLSSLRWLGRSATLEFRNLYRTSPDDRTTFEGLGAVDAQVAFTNGTNTLTIDFNGQNYLDDVADDLGVGTDYMQTLRLKSFYDVAVGGDQPDLSVTYA